MKSIVALCMNPSVDINTSIDHVVAERKLRCGTIHYEPGGGGVNVSRAIQNLGGQSRAYVPCGGPTGEALMRLLEQESIIHYPLMVKSWTRENFIVFEKKTKRQYRFGTPGAKLSNDEWHTSLEEMASLTPKPDMVVASGSLPPGVPDDFYARLVERLKKCGITVLLDTSGEPLRQALKKGVYLIKPNLRELGILVDDDLNGESDQKDAAMELVASGRSRIVVVSLGAAGVILASENRVERIHAPTVTIQSKVGAGDSMLAGIALKLAHDKPLREAVCFGVAAGTAAVMTPGTELCRREDTQRLFNNMKERY